MELAYVTAYNAQDVHQWSGSGYYIARSLEQHSVSLNYVGPLEEQWLHKGVRKLKRHYYELLGQRYLRDPEPCILKSYAQQVAQKLSVLNPDIIFSVNTNPIAYLDCKQPLVICADATFAGLKDFYPHYSNLCQETVEDWHRMEQLALQKSSLAIYASDWAAQTAIDHYHADPAKVKVVPFGANLETGWSFEQVQSAIQSRSRSLYKLLFIGVDWYRKGGDIAFEVAKQLNARGVSTELTVVGCDPVLDEPVPGFVRPLGFISKSTPKGKAKIEQLLAESHFLIVPSRAECYGLVFCEANALGVPSIAARVGGVPTIVKDNINGKLFAADADISEYCDYLARLFTNYSQYQELAESAFQEYQSRLNWSVAGRSIKALLETL